ncbi:MAG: hypothetical protein EYC68_15405 [Chloroflexota bacterium]|nr:MAG: hypothetical protein EYC68_15405 [Chloroflexota bacterium]
MLSRKLIPVLGILLFTVFAVLAVPSARAETDAQNLRGKLLTIDLRAKTLQVRQGNGATKTLTFSKKTQFVRNGKKSKVKSLVLRDTLQVKFKANSNAVQVTATGPASKRVAGQLNDANKGSGTVIIKGKTLQANAQTQIVRNGAIVSLSRLTRQDKVVAHVKPTAAEGNGGAEAFDLIAHGPEEDEVHGTISAIAGNQVSIAPSNGTPVVTVNVTSETMIEVDDHNAALGDLAVGMQVEADYDPTTMNAFDIEADSDGDDDDAHVIGTVSAVDAAAGTITIAPTNGGSVTLTVKSSTEIEVNDKHASLEDVQVGMPVKAEYDSMTLIATEIEAGSDDDNDDDDGDHELKGTVAAVNVAAQTVTITPNSGGSDVTLNVTAGTEIEINDEDATLAEITVGAEIKAEYDPATLNAHELEIGDDDHDDDDD